MYPLIFLLRLAAVGFFTVALAGPRSVLEESVIHTEGIDMVLAIDASGSMGAEDFVKEGARHNRLEIVKDVVKEFIEHRPHDHRLYHLRKGGKRLPFNHTDLFRPLGFKKNWGLYILF